MKNTKRILLLTTIFLFSAALQFWGQTPGGSATYLTKADIDALVASDPGDTMMRMINAGGVHMGVAVLKYAKGERANVTAISHGDIAEVYYVLKGEGTMVTGGTIENGKQFPADSAPAKVAGPSTSGKATGTVSRKIGPGDAILVPVNTPHYTIDVTSDISFLIVRVDPTKKMELK